MKKKLAVLAIVMAVLAVPVATALGASVTPQVVSKSQTGDGWKCSDGTKIENPRDGRFRLRGGGWVDIDVSGKKFDFDTDPNHLVNSVLVKGGPLANLYIYPNRIDNDDRLKAPRHPRNGRQPGLSHICFMTSKKRPSNGSG